MKVDSTVHENVDYVHGVQPSLLALQCKYRKVAEIIVQDGIIEKEWLHQAQKRFIDDIDEDIPFKATKISKNPRNAAMNALIEEIKLFDPNRVQILSKHDMNLMVEQKSHQGVILVTSKGEFHELPVISGKKEEAYQCGLSVEVDPSR